MKIGSIQAFLEKQSNLDISINYYRLFFLLAVRRVSVIYRIYKAMKQSVRDKNIFTFLENEESRLYRNFLTKWEESWKEKPKEKDACEEKTVRQKKITNKLISVKSKTYMEVCPYEYGDLKSVVNDIKDKTLGKMENENKVLKFRYLILSVITNRLSQVD